VLVDSNVLLDIATGDPAWSGWSADALASAAERYALIINPIVYAEVSIGYDNIEALEEALPVSLYRREQLPSEAGFLAGKCFCLVSAPGRAKAFAAPRFLHRGPMPQFADLPS
jgi:hypothetical protein